VLSATAPTVCPVNPAHSIDSNKINPFTPEGSKLPKSFVEDLRLTRASNSTIKIGTGAAKDNENILDITLDNLITLDITKSGSGGLDTGSEASSTWYNIHVIGKSADTSTGTNTTATANKLIDSAATFQADGVNVGDIVFNTTDATQAKVSTVDSETQLTLDTDIFTATSKAYIAGPRGIGLFSTSESAPTLPTGYLYFLRVGTWRNDGNSHFLNGMQYGKGKVRKYVYDESDADLAVLNNGNATAAGGTDVDCSSFVPSTSESILFLIAFETGGSGAFEDKSYMRPNGLIDSNWPFTFSVGVKSAGKSRRIAEVPCDTSQKIEYKVDNTNNQLTLVVSGYTDEI